MASVMTGVRSCPLKVHCPGFGTLTSSEIRRSTTIDAVASAIFLAATPLAIILVRRVTEAMEAKRGSIPADAVPVAS